MDRTHFSPRLPTIREGKENEDASSAKRLAGQVKKNQQGATNSIKALRQADQARRAEAGMRQVLGQLEDAILLTHEDSGHDRMKNHAALKRAIGACLDNPLVAGGLSVSLKGNMSEASKALKAGKVDNYDGFIRRMRNDINRDVFDGESSPNAKRILALANSPAKNQS